MEGCCAALAVAPAALGAAVVVVVAVVAAVAVLGWPWVDFVYLGRAFGRRPHPVAV